MKSIAIITTEDVLNRYYVLKIALTISKLNLNVRIFCVSSDKSATLTQEKTVGRVQIISFPSLDTFFSGTADKNSELLSTVKLQHYFAACFLDFMSKTKSTLSLIHSFGIEALPIPPLVLKKLSQNDTRTKWIHTISEKLETLPKTKQDIYESLFQKHTYIQRPDVLIASQRSFTKEAKVKYTTLAKIPVVLDAPEIDEFSPNNVFKIREKFGIKHQEELAVCTTDSLGKSIELVLKAMVKFPDLHLMIITNSKNEYIKNIKRVSLANGISNRIHWHKYIHQSKISSLLAECTFGLIIEEDETSKVEYPPAELFKYLQASVPLVVSDYLLEAKNFVAENKIGVAFKAKSVDDIVSKIDFVLKNQYSLRENFSSSLLRKYSWENQQQELFQIYGRLLELPLLTTMKKIPIKDSLESSRTSDLRFLRSLHGVGGAANQPFTVAKALRKLGYIAENLAVAPSKFEYGVTYIRPIGREKIWGCANLIEDLAEQFDIFQFYAMPILWQPPSMAFPTGIDILLLKTLGKVVIYSYRGTEARLESVFRKVAPYHYCDEGLSFLKKFPEQEQKIMMSFISGVADRVLVPDPELQTYVPNAIIVPRAIDLNEWPNVGVKNQDNPLVVHAPSRKAVKGSESVIAAVKQLKNEGLNFNFELIEGLSNVEARKRYEQADVIIDQLRIGWYGVLAVEGMALGKAVISYIRNDLKHHLGNSPPIALANPDNITDVLRSLIQDKERRIKLGITARQYCEKIHCSEKVALQLIDIYTDAVNSPKPIDLLKISSFLEFQYRQKSF